jgi:hypothetical protein
MSLKRRVSGPAQAQGQETTFLEWLSPVSVGNIAECHVKVRSMGGAKLRVKMHGVAPEVLASIIRDFAGLS